MNKEDQPNSSKSFGDVIDKHPIKVIATAVILAVGIAWGVFKEVMLIPLQNELTKAKIENREKVKTFNCDPLSIFGTWDYEVTAEQGKKIRARNPKTNALEERFIKFKGNIYIDTLKRENGRYEITGTRTDLINADGIDEMKDTDEVKLGFPEVDFDSYSNNKFSFKFVVAVGEDQGFVRITELTPNIMSGYIHYLYSDKQWRKVNIKFVKRVR